MAILNGGDRRPGLVLGGDALGLGVGGEYTSTGNQRSDSGSRKAGPPSDGEAGLADPAQGTTELQQELGGGDTAGLTVFGEGSSPQTRSARHSGDNEPRLVRIAATLGNAVSAFRDALREGSGNGVMEVLEPPKSTGNALAVIGAAETSSTDGVSDGLTRSQRRRRAADGKFDGVPVADPEVWRRHAAAGAGRTVIDVMNWQIQHSPVGPYLPRRAALLAEGYFSTNFNNDVRGVTVKHQEDRPNAFQHAINEAMRLLKERAVQAGVEATLYGGVSQVQAVRLAVDNLNNTPTATKLGLKLEVMQLVTDGETSETATCYVDAHAASQIIQGETDRTGGLVQGRADYGVELTRPEGNVNTALHHTVVRLPDQTDKDRVLVVGLNMAYLQTPILRPGAEPDPTKQGLFEVTAVPLRRGTDNDSIIALLNSGTDQAQGYVDAAGTVVQTVTIQRQDLPRAVSWLADTAVLGKQAEQLLGAPIVPNDTDKEIVDAELVID